MSDDLHKRFRIVIDYYLTLKSLKYKDLPNLLLSKFAIKSSTAGISRYINHGEAIAPITAQKIIKSIKSLLNEHEEIELSNKLSQPEKNWKSNKKKSNSEIEIIDSNFINVLHEDISFEKKEIKVILNHLLFDSNSFKLDLVNLLKNELSFKILIRVELLIKVYIKIS